MCSEANLPPTDFEVSRIVSLGSGPIKSLDCSGNAPLTDVEVEREYFRMDVASLARQHQDKVGGNDPGSRFVVVFFG